MNSLLRALLVWLLILALPFQGMASASMLACMPAAQQQPAMPMDGTAHDHAAMPKAAAVANAGHCAGEPHHGDRHAGASDSCGACCLGATMAPTALPPLLLLPSHFSAIPFRAGHVPSVAPALPERPPRTAFA